jgi:hypothetical protein
MIFCSVDILMLGSEHVKFSSVLNCLKHDCVLLFNLRNEDVPAPCCKEDCSVICSHSLACIDYLKVRESSLCGEQVFGNSYP